MSCLGTRNILTVLMFVNLSGKHKHKPGTYTIGESGVQPFPKMYHELGNEKF